MVPKLEKILDEMFPGVERPSLLDLEKGASLTLHFGHQFIGDGNRPITPNHIYIGMMNCREPKQLPEDLQKFMDSGKDGVIYVSFGYVIYIWIFIVKDTFSSLIPSDQCFKPLKCLNPRG